MMTSLKKCNRVDVYSLICDNQNNSNDSLINNFKNADKRLNKINNGKSKNIYGECLIEQFHLEFVTKQTLHYPLFNVFDFNQSLRILKLTQCNEINHNSLSKLPDNLQEIYLMNTLINVDSWSNLKHLKSLIITNSANLHSNNKKLLELIADTLPSQILNTICVWDGQEENKHIIKKLVENHNRKLTTFGLGGRICLYGPFSFIFTDDDCKSYFNLEIITISCLSTEEITQLINEFGHQLRICELYCPFIMDAQDQDGIDIYKWLLDESINESFYKILNKLEIFMIQAFPHHMKRYINDNQWTHLRQRFQNKFAKYRSFTPPLMLFDFGIDLNKISLWTKPNIGQYLLDNAKSLELNFGQGLL